jgi:hypothetical protein
LSERGNRRGTTQHGKQTDGTMHGDSLEET